MTTSEIPVHGPWSNETLPSGWRLALYTSAALSIVQAVGNVALYVVRPKHWPVLESVEALEMASIIPIALLLHRLNRESPFSLPLTIGGVLGSVVGVAISIGFVTELAAFGQGFIGGLAYWAAALMVGIWLVSANAVAWRAGKVRGFMVPLALLFYGVWAIVLARRLKFAT